MKKFIKTELLAPAKNKEIAFSAIDCGADAVYIGAPMFGARKNASNTLEDIKEVVDYAHKFWAKVFVTINTILNDEELKSAVELALKLEQIEVDALIIQDMGLLNELKKLIEKNKFSTPIHISTQCDNYSPQKVAFFNNLGVKRVVLARETSLEKIKQIHLENPNLELEMFCHGALCVSFSGQCYLSKFIGNRSGNRGECAQPCRKKYSIIDDKNNIIKQDFYALSLKDFNASKKVQELIDAGIYSFKIEGRLKDENYVKNIVAYYSKLLKNKPSSGNSFYNFKPNPAKSFNRGFTEYFLNNKREECFNFISPKSNGEYLGEVVEIKPNCFKISNKIKINSQDGLVCKDFGFLVNKFENNWIYPNKKINLTKGDKIYRNFDVEFEKALAKPVKRQIGVTIIFENGIIKLIDKDKISITYELKEFEHANNIDKMKENFIKQFSKTGETDFYIKEINIKSDLPFIPISELNSLRNKVLADLMKARIDFYNKNLKQKQTPLKYTKFYLAKFDYRANVYNESAIEFYKNCGCEITEMALEKQIPQRQIALMHCKHCIKYALNMCKSPKKLFLKDEKEKIYPLNFDCKNCEMSVMSK